MKIKKNFSSHLFGKSIIHFLFCLLFIAGLFSDVFNLNAQSDNELDMVIMEAVWTNGVDNRIPREKESVHSLQEPLYLWIRLKGGETALNYLKVNNSIPIEVHWFYIIGKRILPSGISNLSINNEKLQKLAQEVEERGFFDWRTRARKANIGHGWFKARIYTNDSPIVCQNGERQAYCEYEIEVR